MKLKHLTILLAVMLIFAIIQIKSMQHRQVKELEQIRRVNERKIDSLTSINKSIQNNIKDTQNERQEVDMQREKIKEDEKNIHNMRNTDSILELFTRYYPNNN